MRTNVFTLPVSLEQVAALSHSTHSLKAGACASSQSAFPKKRLTSAPQWLLSQPLARRQLIILTRDFKRDAIFQSSFPKRAIDVTKNFSSIESQGFYLIVSLPSGLPPHQSKPMPTAKKSPSSFSENVKVFLTNNDFGSPSTSRKLKHGDLTGRVLKECIHKIDNSC